MEIIFRNNIIIKDPTSDILSWAEENLVITNPIYSQLCKMGKEQLAFNSHVSPTLNLFVTRGNVVIIPRGCMYILWNMIKIHKCPFKAEFNADHSLSISKNTKGTLTPYDYQEKAINALISAKGGILQAPTASGKTLMAAEITRRIGLRTLFLTHTHDLLEQAKKRFLTQYPSLKWGTITDGKVNMGEDVTFATWQTMAKIEKDIYKDYFNVVIADEIHHVATTPTQIKKFGKVIENINCRYTFGLSATPFRSDGLTKAIYTTLGLNPSGEFAPTFTLTREDIGSVTAQHVDFILNTPAVYSFLTADGMIDYDALVNFLSSDETRNNAIVDEIVYSKHLSNSGGFFLSIDKSINRKQIVLCSRVDQAKIICDKLIAKGEKAVLLIGEVSNKIRKEILENTNTWDVVVATYSLAKEGLDIPELSVLHLATPQKDEATIIQCAGRIERKMAGKPMPYIIDYVDNNIAYCVSAYKKRKRILKNRN